VAAESGYLQVLGAFWEWVQKDLGLWLRALGSLRDVLTERDIESDETLITSLRLSAFSLVIAIAMDVAAESIFTRHQFSATYGLSLVVIYYLCTLCYTVGLKLMSILVVSPQSMRKCFVMALFMSVYWPLHNLSQFIVYENGGYLIDVASLKLSNDLPSDVLFAGALTAVVDVFIFVRVTSAIRHVFHVGLIRSMLAAVGDYLIFVFFSFILMRPVVKALLNQIFSI
jgi:hypothetical protein